LLANLHKLQKEPPMESLTIFDVPVTLGKYDYLIHKIISMSSRNSGGYVCVLNVHMMIEAQRKPAFKNILKAADLVLPDGKPITWALKILKDIKQDRVAGMDIVPDLFRELEKKGASVFFFGGTEEMLEGTKAYITNEFPALKIAGCHAPPFRELTKQEDEENIARINGSGAAIIFIVLGCPKQEIWMSVMKDRINGVMIGVGGALPVVIGDNKRAPLWMQRNGLEWFFRFIQEPKRLFKRYAVTNAWFLYLLCKGYFKKLAAPKDSSK
jgi:N-acetylglucosaminyldiphosphoundecaprenol N-acetyl-beta-D-mannosaminyltransferase